MVSFDTKHDLKKEMTEKLYEGVKDSEAFGLLYGIAYQLSRLPPNGARNHRLNSLRSRVVLRGDMLKEGYWLPRTATISDYRTLKFEEYKNIMGLLEEAERDFNIDPTMVMYPTAAVEEEALAVV